MRNEHIMQRCYRCEALTDIWTGDIDGKPDRLITTGILGSIRWWFEVVVRGLKGFACDPSAKSKTCQDDKHCVVCELFGCTGWARKFRFDVLEEDGCPQEVQIEKDAKFQFRFTPLRPIHDEEWMLLDLTLRLIADYGAIGGKTVYKPTKETDRRCETHHQDFGLVEIIARPKVNGFQRADLEKYVTQNHWHWAQSEGFAWASIHNFWAVRGRYLAREQAKKCSYNRVLGRKEDKSVKERSGRRVVRWSDLFVNRNDQVSRWLAGGRGESKKVFSFREPARTFGFVKPDTIDHSAIQQRLQDVWPSFSKQDYQKGSAILDELLHAREAS